MTFTLTSIGGLGQPLVTVAAAQATGYAVSAAIAAFRGGLVRMIVVNLAIILLRGMLICNIQMLWGNDL